MRRVYAVLCMLMLLSYAEVGLAQKRIYVSGEGDDTSTTPSLVATPYKTITKALSMVSDETEIRVMIGEYLLEEELNIPANVSLLGGYENEGRWGNAAEKTLLVGNGKSRVVRLKGVLEGVTVKGGYVVGENGGGVYVEEGGKLINCIITENTADIRMIKIGDLLLKDKSIIDVSEFDPNGYKNVIGVVFWVNPDRRAELGNKGLASSIKSIMEAISDKKTIAIGDIAKKNMRDAILDMKGEENTRVLLEHKSPAAEWVKEVGGYLPSLGEWMLLATEMTDVATAYNILWDKMYAEYKEAKMREFFGVFYDADYKLRYHSIDITNDADRGTSTVASNKEVWMLDDPFKACEVKKSIIADSKRLIAVIKF